MAARRKYNGSYTGEFLNFVGFPLGGIGAGMICLNGTGMLSHFSVRNNPDCFNDPYAFSAICVKGEPNLARVLEGPVPPVRIFTFAAAGNGGGTKTFGFPRFASASFKARFPFGVVTLTDPQVPLKVEVTGWSPFVPCDEDNSSLPVLGLEYRFTNTSGAPVDAVYSFNPRNIMAVGKEGSSVTPTTRGFVLRQAAYPDRPWEKGDLCVEADADEVAVNCQWFRGAWFDPQTIAWRDILQGDLIRRPAYSEGAPSPGASLYVPLRLAPGESKVVRLMISWSCPDSDVRRGPGGMADPVNSSCNSQKANPKKHRPWYAGRFDNVEAVADYWRRNYATLRRKSAKFSRCFYDTTLPPEVVEAIAANLTILKSPTCLRQEDGRFWGWEGCNDQSGCCPGSCTHVWNYAQAMCHLFPALERTMRATEFGEAQDERGHQQFRAPVPIRPADHASHAASDGQLGGIMKVYREWRISGDTEWLRGIWPRVKASLDYCIETWDPDHAGVLREPHHNTYDIEFWGPDGMCTSFYLGALTAAAEVGRVLGEDVTSYEALRRSGAALMEKDLFDGEYFFQKVEWRNLRAGDPTSAQALVTNQYSPEAVELLQREGPKYQYGRGCLSDGVLGAWIAACCGLPGFLDPEKVKSHLLSVHKYNLRKDLSGHANPQRPTYAVGNEGGLLLCTWPKGGRLSLPFVYSEEVWTGIEYQVASHLMMVGLVEEGLEIVRTCRDRYDGRVRNPFDEYECGHWYARAMASYGLIQGLAGAWYDAVEKVLHLRPRIRGDFRAFLSTASGYGTAGVKDGKPFLEVAEGMIPVVRLDYTPAPA